jgi:4-amino-4-deoxy-L-arabinose transferase-like glycosyltransferase
MRQTAVWPLLLILAVGAVLRLGLWCWFDGRPLNIVDEQEYDALARNLAERGELAFEPGRPATIRPPLYPAAVAGIYLLFGVDNFQAVRLCQAGLSLLTVLLLYRLGAAAFSPRVGLWLAGLYCFYPSMLGLNNLLLTEVLFTFLLVAFCCALLRALRRASVGALLLAGVLLGLAALTRSVMWLFPALLAPFLLFAWEGGWRRRLLAAAAVTAAFAATVAPWAARNTRVEQTFVVIDTMGGRNFMMGNYRHTPLTRAWDAIALEGEQSWVHEVVANSRPQERDTQGKLDKLALRRGVKFVAENPGVTLERDVVKFFNFWGLERELVAGAGRGYFGQLSKAALLLLSAVIFGSYAAAVLAGVFGAVLAPPPDRRVHALFLLLIAFLCGMHTLVFAHSRYHLPVMPLVLAYAASAVVSRHELWQRRGWPFRLACGLCGVFVLGWAWEVVFVDFQRFASLLGA